MSCRYHTIKHSTNAQDRPKHLDKELIMPHKLASLMTAGPIPEETHFLGHADGIPLFQISIGIPPICFHFNRIPSSQNAPVSKHLKKGGAVVSNNGVQHSGQSTPKDMIGKLKLQHTVHPPEGWEEHMFGLRDRRHSLTPHPSITNTPMLPSPSLQLDNQIHDEDSAMEEVEKNPNNNENKDDQLSSNENEDDLLSGSENEDDWLPGSNDDDKGSDYNENENDDKEMESLSNSHGFGASLVMQWWDDDDDAHTHNAQTVSCAQSPLPPSFPLVYKSGDSAHPVGDIVHPCQEGGLIYTRLQKKGKARVDNAKTQFSGLAEAWSNLEDIVIVGVVMYVAQDPAGCQTSGIFGGSEMIRNFINENGTDVQSLMDKYTIIFKCLRNGNSVDARVAGTSSIGDMGSALELCCHTKETLRDCNHRVFKSMMKEKMLAALRDLHVTHGIEFLQKSHLTIVNWPHSVSPPGPGFEYKKLKAGALHQLVVPYLQRKLGLLYDGQTNDEEEQDSLDDVLEIEIKCWNKEVIDISDADPLKSEIALIKATDGTVLWQISDDPEWQKSLKETDCWQQDMEVL
ncbi:hypothetical protein F5J12DRAFT_785822 [Pisolithus orientalis]|uniref:uncharacterized protein n=1 Tax=Pisolithus orientalis TaxID=936130 RepID=UPI0022252A01|nr:uncharacterized protein F5J12DRAFT_785822 [Pisolithus orientalis]KAI5994260.1 hypothetical protein F5J12DRAFT_785822 [Pisolithus orientalis]